MQKVLCDKVYGLSEFMRIEFSDGIEEITAYYRNSGVSYKTTADNNPERRQQIVEAFCDLA